MGSETDGHRDWYRFEEAREDFAILLRRGHVAFWVTKVGRVLRLDSGSMMQIYSGRQLQQFFAQYI